MPDPIPDATLLAHFQAGDQEAFAVLLARYHGLVRAACTRQAAPGEVDDCVQAVFLVLSRRPKAAMRVGNLPGWLLTTAWYVCRRTNRARARRQRAERVVAQQATACDIPSEPEALAHLDECLRRLPEGQRTVITLHDLVGQSFDEIAGRLGLTRDHVYQLRHRGLGTIRQLLARRGFAVGAAAVASLFASQAQAASTTNPVFFATLCASPKPAAITLATGAMTAMTVATATPFAIAASLILMTGITSSVLTAEKSPAPVVPGTVAAPVLQPATTSFLDQELSVDFEDREFRTAMAEIGRKAGFTPVVSPDLGPAPVTLRVEKMKLRHIIPWMSQLSGSEYQVSGTTIRFTPVPPIVTRHEQGLLVTAGMTTEGQGPVPEAFDISQLPTAVRDRMEQRLTADLSETPLVEALTFVKTVTGMNIIVDPALIAAADVRPVTLTLRDLPLKDVIDKIAAQAAVRIAYRYEALFVFDPKLVGKPLTPSPTIPPVKPIPKPDKMDF